MDARAYLRYALLAVAVLAMGTLSQPASAQDNLVVTITNSGIVTSIDEPAGGLYNVTVKNETGDYRGIVMKGNDLGGSRFLRFSKVLDPGEQQSFRWYFPSDQSVKLRDLMCCTHAERTCIVAGYGGMTKSVGFGGL